MARAGLFSVLATSLAATLHHLAFDSSPSLAARGLAALVLFAAALPGAGRDQPLVRHLELAFAGQVLLCAWFMWADGAVSAPAYELWSSSEHPEGAIAAARAALTALSAVLLYGLRRRVLLAAGRQWRALRALVRRLLAPVGAPPERAAADAERRTVPAPARAPPPPLLLADTVIRRGPPLPRPRSA
ncbi:hypothetical protein [Streptomyces sp. G45]|uniref:hypothetical protein n=1 Tax=Streptomyces sp. G45 TaxID=3406627 RepID=UPI003C1ED263